MKNFPRLVLNLKGLSNDKIITSIVIPVFNQESRIIQNVRSILENSILAHEIIIINDSSTDNTLGVLITELPNIINLSKFCCSISLWHFKRPVYETQCDVSGIEISKAKYILEIQADMKILEYGFDKKFLQAIQSYSDIIMLSGRGTEKVSDFYSFYLESMWPEKIISRSFCSYIFKLLTRFIKHLIPIFTLTFIKNYSKDRNFLKPHLFKNEIFPDSNSFGKSGRAGKLGLNVNANIFCDKRKIWLGETVMRGPLFIDKKKYYEVGGFDIEKFFLGFDDHDLAVRSWALRNYRCGYVPVNYFSPLEDGSTRKNKSLEQEIQLIRNLFRIKNKWKNSFLFNYENFFRIKPVDYEIRNF